MPSISRKLFLGMSLVFLVAGGCKERQEPAPPESPAVVRKRIEEPKPLTAEAVKPIGQEAVALVAEEGPPKTEAPDLPPPEPAQVKPPLEEKAATPQITAEPKKVVEKPDKGTEAMAGPASERLSAPEMPPAGTFTITLASFKPKQSADRHVEELKKLGIDAYVWEVNLPEKGRWYRVSTGRFPTLKEARNHTEELRQKGISGTYITKITEPS